MLGTLGKGAQCVDIPPIFQGDLTLKLSAKAKPSAPKRKEKSAKVSIVKKQILCVIFFDLVIFVMFSS